MSARRDRTALVFYAAQAIVWFALLYQFYKAFHREDWKIVGLLGGTILMLAIFESARMIVRAIEDAAEKVSRK
jgi:hypothetical protein